MEFDQDFEETILAQALRDTEYLKAATRLLDVHHFSTPQLGWIWKTIKGSWLDFAERPTPRALKARAMHDFVDEDERAVHLELTLRLFRRKPEAPKMALGLLQQFVRFVSVQVALERGATALERGKVDEAFASLRKATLRDLRPRAYKVTRWMEEFDDRQRERKHRAEHPEEYVCIPTGLARVDDVLDGGLRQGELGLVVGTTSIGKSIFLNHLGFQGIIHGFGVVHFSLEMSDRAVAARYDSRFTGMLHKKFKTWGFSASELREIDLKVRRNRARLKDRLRIISMPLRSCDVNSLRHAVEEMRAEMTVHMVLVDSGDHLKSIDKHESLRLEQTENYWGLKGFAEEEGLVLWSSTHAPKEYEKKLAGTAATSESYDKARICDVMLTLNPPGLRSRTSKIVEGEDPEAGPTVVRPVNLELNLAKYRDGEARIRIPLSNELERMLIQEADEEEETK